MLKGISKLLTGDILKELCDMGHGDTFAIVDANYPAKTMGKKVISYPGVTATELLKAIVSIMPMDHIVERPIILMDMELEDKNSGMHEPEIWAEFEDVIRNEYGEQSKITKISRKEFYEASKNASFIVQTGEERLYGNVIFVKGVL